MRIVLGEGYPYPAHTTFNTRTGEEFFGIKVYDREGRSHSLDRAAILQAQKYWVRVVLEVVELGEETPPSRLRPYAPMEGKETP